MYKYEYSFIGLNTSTGGVLFQNIEFIGTKNLVNAEYCIRLFFNNCTIYGFENMFIITNTDSLMQSIYLTNCLIRKISNYLFKSELSYKSVLYDIKMISCIVEWGGGITHVGCMQGSSFSHNCIEGMQKELFFIYCHANQVTISENYFEENVGSLINLRDNTLLDSHYYSITIANNVFFETKDSTSLIIPEDTMNTHSRLLIYGNRTNVNSSKALIETSATKAYEYLTCFSNYGNVIDPNTSMVTMDQTLTTNLTLMNKYTSLYKCSKALNGMFMSIALSNNMIYVFIELPFLIRGTYESTLTSPSILNIGSPDSIELVSNYPSRIVYKLDKSGAFEQGKCYLVTLRVDIATVE